MSAFSLFLNRGKRLLGRGKETSGSEVNSAAAAGKRRAKPKIRFRVRKQTNKRKIYLYLFCWCFLPTMFSVSCFSAASGCAGTGRATAELEVQCCCSAEVSPDSGFLTLGSAVARLPSCSGWNTYLFVCPKVNACGTGTGDRKAGGPMLLFR